MLKISVLRAHLTKDTRSFSKMDPWVRISYDKAEAQTKVNENGGKEPQWDQTFHFPFKKEVYAIVFMVYDRDGSKDIFLGNHSLKVTDFLQNQFYDEVSINKSGSVNGKLLIKAVFDNPQAQPIPPPPAPASTVIIQQAPPPPPPQFPPQAMPPAPQFVMPPAPVPMAGGVPGQDNSWLTNLSYFKKPTWFKNNSNEIKSYIFEESKWVDQINANGTYLHQSFNTQELPDQSYLIVGGIENNQYTNKTLHYYNGYFYPKNPMKYPKIGHCTAYKGGQVWVMGGFMGQVLNVVQVFDMNTGAWTDGPPLTIARTDATACMIDSDQVYIFGGQNPAVPGGPILNTIQFLNFNHGLWTIFSIPMPLALVNPVAAQVSPSQILVMGGSNGVECSKKVNVFIRSTGQWQECSDLAVPLTSIMECYYSNQKVNLFGGSTAPSDFPPTHITYPLQIVFS